MPLENLAFQAGKLVASESMEAGDDDRISGSEVLAQLRDLVESGQLHPELAEKVIQELTAEPESIGSSPDPEVVKKVVAQLGRKSAKSP
jgi:chorismate mutase